MPSRGLWSAGVAWATATGAAGWVLLRLVGSDWGTPAAQIVPFTPYAAAAAAVGAFAALVARRWRPAVITAVAAAVLITLVAPRAVAGDPPGAGRSLRVLSVNLMIGAADPQAIVAVIRRERVDVLALQEFTEAAQAGLTSAGLDTLLPHRVLHPRGQALGSALYSRLPLTEPGVRTHRSGFLQAQAAVTADGVAVAIESAHPRPPIGPRFDDSWFADLADQPAQVAGELRILAGDFNATLDHAPFRQLLGRGYRDAAELTGSALKPTWPADRWWFPGLVLDHVLVSTGLGVRSYAVQEIAGTDHRAVLADVALPAR